MSSVTPELTPLSMAAELNERPLWNSEVEGYDPKRLGQIVAEL